jgi:hypothetical protein
MSVKPNLGRNRPAGMRKQKHRSVDPTPSGESQEVSSVIACRNSSLTRGAAFSNNLDYMMASRSARLLSSHLAGKNTDEISGLQPTSCFCRAKITDDERAFRSIADNAMV